MIIKHKVNKQIEKDIIDDILCNKCGNSCLSGNYSKEDKCFDGILEHTVSGSYYSKKLGDMTEYTFSMCETCLLDLFNTFVIKPEIYEPYG